MTVFGMTVKQHKLLAWIEQYVNTNGHAPSYEEMKVAMGYASKSGIHRLIHGLRERGLIDLKPNKKRIITLNVPAFDSAKGIGM